MYSTICMDQGLKHYALIHSEYPNASLIPDIEFCVTLSEIVSIMKIASSYVTFVQYEKLYTAVLGYLRRVRNMAEYRDNEYTIVDLNKVTLVTQLPTITKNSLSLLELENKR